MKILISEDHELFRDGLVSLLKDVFDSLEIIESPDFCTTQTLLHQHQDIDLLLFDICLPGTTGLEGLKQVKQTFPVLPLVVISTVNQQASIQNMIQLGADGFISKTSARKQIIQGLKDVLKGEKIIVSEDPGQAVINLSPRQKDIIEHLDQGLSNKEIAGKLNLSSTTVRDYVSDIFRLFCCDNRTQLAMQVRKLGYIID